MKKILLILILVFFMLNFVSATIIRTNEETTIIFFREKIEIDGENINVTDVFALHIPYNFKNGEIFLAFEKEGNIPGFSYILCENPTSERNYLVRGMFGVECSDAKRENKLYREKKDEIVIRYDAEKLNWTKYLNQDSSKTIYFQVDYNMPNFISIIEEHSTLWVPKIECSSHSQNCLNTKPISYVILSNDFFVDGGYNYAIFDVDKENEKMIFISQNSEEDMVISYQDVKKEKWENIKWFIFGIFLSFVLSLIATKLGGMPDIAFIVSTLFFIFLLIVIGSVVVDYNFRIALLIFFGILIFLLFNLAWQYFINGSGIEDTRKLWKKIKTELAKQKDERRTNKHTK